MAQCNIKQKADLMVMGVPPAHLFDNIIEVDDLKGTSPKLLGERNH
jgi:hypothetical protein